jgi:hypothetical protein
MGAGAVEGSAAGPLIRRKRFKKGIIKKWLTKKTLLDFT